MVRLFFNLALLHILIKIVIIFKSICVSLIFLLMSQKIEEMFHNFCLPLYQPSASSQAFCCSPVQRLSHTHCLSSKINSLLSTGSQLLSPTQRHCLLQLSLSSLHCKVFPSLPYHSHKHTETQ